MKSIFLPHKFSTYQNEGFQKLVKYKNSFRTDVKRSGKALTEYKKRLSQHSTEFIDLFCIHDLANTDYGLIQAQPLQYASFKNWVEDCTIESILKSITFYIWTDRIESGYFITKVQDGSVYLLLRRLENLLANSRK